MTMKHKRLGKANAKLMMHYEEYLSHFTENFAVDSPFTHDADVQTFFIMTLIQCHDPRVKSLLQNCNKPIDATCLKFVYTINLLNDKQLPMEDIKTSGNWYEVYAQWHDIVIPFLKDAVSRTNVSESVMPQLIEKTVLGDSLKRIRIPDTIIENKVKSAFLSFDNIVAFLIGVGGLAVIHLAGASIEQQLVNTPDRVWGLSLVKIILSIMLMDSAMSIGANALKFKNSLFIDKEAMERMVSAGDSNTEYEVLALFLKAIVLQSVIQQLKEPVPWLADRIENKRVRKQAVLDKVETLSPSTMPQS